MGRSRPDQRGRLGDPAAAQRRLALLTAELGTAPLDASPAPLDDPAGGPLTSDSGRGDDAEPARHRAPALPGWKRLIGAAADQLPVPRGHDERGLTGQHVAVVALLVAALVTAGAWWVLSGRPQEQAAAPLVHAPSPTAGDAAADPAADPASADDTDSGDSDPAGSVGSVPGDEAADASAAETIVVDVAGRVRRPGLVTLPSGARVADAVQSAGGAFPRVDMTSLNLARPLVDGEQLLVGAAPATDPGALPSAGTGLAAPGTPPALVDLNTATMEQLDALPGVGPVTGQAILDWRAANGGFTSVDQLLEVDGIGEVTLADLRDLVTV